MFKSDKRLILGADGKVREAGPGVEGFVLIGKGGEMSDADAIRYGLKPKPAPKAQSQPAAQTAAAKAKAAAEAQAKAKAAAESKAEPAKIHTESPQPAEAPKPGLTVDKSALDALPKD